MSGTTSGGTHAEKWAENPTSLGAARAAGLARVASRKLAVLSEATRNAVLEAAAKRLEENAARIVSANTDDVGDAEELVQAGQISGIMAGPPFLRHPFGERPKVCAVDLFSPAEDGFKTLPSRYILID